MNDNRIVKIRKLLSKSDKTRGDLQSLYELLSSTPLKESFFKPILAIGKNEEFLHEVCRGFKYKFYRRGQVIFEQGDTKTDYLYFIIKGKVGVYINNFITIPKSGLRTSQPSNQELLVNKSNQKFSSLANKNDVFRHMSHVGANAGSTASRFFFFQTSPENDNGPLLHNRANFNEDHKSYLMQQAAPDSSGIGPNRGSVNDLSIGIFRHLKASKIFIPTTGEQSHMLKIFERFYLEDTTKLSEAEMKEIESQYGNKIRELECWSLFGERALERSKPRTATIVCIMNTEVIRIRQSDYLNVIKGALKTKKHKLCEFIADTLGILKKGQDEHIIPSILPTIEKLHIKKGHVLVRQGDPIKKLFIILKGELKLLKSIESERPDKFYDGLPENVIDYSLTSLTARSIPIGLCSAKEYIGEEFLFDHINFHEYAIECSSMKSVVVAIKSSIIKFLPSRVHEKWKPLYFQKRQNRIQQFQRSLRGIVEDRRRLSALVYRIPKLSGKADHSEGKDWRESEMIPKCLKQYTSFTQNIGKLVKQFTALQKVRNDDPLYDFQSDLNISKPMRKTYSMDASARKSPRIGLLRMKSVARTVRSEIERPRNAVQSFYIKKINVNPMYNKTSQRFFSKPIPSG